MSRRLKVLAALAFAVLAVAAVGAGILVSRSQPTADAAVPTPDRSSTAIRSEESVRPEETVPSEETGAAGDAEGTDGDEYAEEAVNPQSGQTLATDAPVPAEGSTVPVTVTFYGWRADVHQVMVGGYVPGVVESDGICTVTLTNGTATVSVDAAATADASSTACGAIVVPGDRLSAGTWQAVLSYSSPEHTGAAAAVPVEVTL